MRSQGFLGEGRWRSSSLRRRAGGGQQTTRRVVEITGVCSPLADAEDEVYEDCGEDGQADEWGAVQVICIDKPEPASATRRLGRC